MRAVAGRHEGRDARIGLAVAVDGLADGLSQRRPVAIAANDRVAYFLFCGKWDLEGRRLDNDARLRLEFANGKSPHAGTGAGP